MPMLENRKAYRHRQGEPDPGDIRELHPSAGRGPGHILFDPGDLLVRPGRRHEMPQHRLRFLGPPLHDEPSGARGHADEPDEEQDSRDATEREHPSPAIGNAGEERVDHVGGEDSEDDRELEQTHSPPPFVGRRGLTDVEGADDARDSHADADQDAARDQPVGIGYEAEKDRTRREDDTRHHVGASSTQLIREHPAHRCADHRPHQHACGDQLGDEVGRLELVFDRKQRTRDHADVVAEQESADRGHETGPERNQTRRSIMTFVHPSAPVREVRPRVQVVVPRFIDMRGSG
jgi:hypothetical protein